MNSGHWVDFELSITGVAERIRVRVGRVSERAVASVAVGALETNGIGSNTREALVAALTPFGSRMTSSVMSAPAMFGASAKLLAAE
jgi:hypothetical protein